MSPRAAGSGRDYRIAVVDAWGKVREEIAGFPSVTTIIHDTDASAGQALMGWAYNVGLAGVAELLSSGAIVPGDDDAKIKAALKNAKLTPWSTRDKAAGRGTDVHELAEQLMKGEASPDDIRGKVKTGQEGYADALLAWHEQYRRKPVLVEATLVSLTHEFAGTCDLIDTDPEQDDARPTSVEVADFKTSKAIYESHFWQCDAYAIAFQEMARRRGRSIVVDAIRVIRFGADGDFEERSVAPLNGAPFLKMRELYAELNGKGVK